MLSSVNSRDAHRADDRPQVRTQPTYSTHAVELSRTSPRAQQSDGTIPNDAVEDAQRSEFNRAINRGDYSGDGEPLGAGRRLIAHGHDEDHERIRALQVGGNRLWLSKSCEDCILACVTALVLMIDQVEVSGLRAQVQIRRAFLLFGLAYVALSCVRRSVMPLNFGK